MPLHVPEEVPVEFQGLVSEKNGEATDEVINNQVSKVQPAPDQRSEVHNLLHEFRDTFYRPGGTPGLTHKVELSSSESVRSKAYRVSARQRSIMEAEVKKMLEPVAIEALESDYTSPFILVKVPG